jgi:Zn-dependent protease
MPHIYDRFTSESLYVMRRIREIIEKEGARQVLPEHMLAAILELNECDAKKLLEASNVNLRQLRKKLTETRDQWPPTQNASGSSVISYMSSSARAVLDQALLEAAYQGVASVSTHHLLLGIVSQQDRLPAQWLNSEDVTYESLRSHLSTTCEHAGDHPDQVLTESPFRISPIFLLLILLTVGAGYACYMEYTENGFFLFLFVLCGWLTSLALHEFGHAVVAYYAGDRSVAKKGYLTLNILKYTHLLFSILMPLLFIIMGGLGLPGGAVYIDRTAIKNERMHSWVAAGGPLATLFCIVLLASIFIGVYIVTPWTFFFHTQFWGAMSLLLLFQLTALIINMLPLPGLDGFHIIAPFMSYERQTALRSANGLTFLFFFFFFFQDNPLRDAFWSLIFTFLAFVPGAIEFIGIGFDLFYFWR